VVNKDEYIKHMPVCGADVDGGVEARDRQSGVILVRS